MSSSASHVTSSKPQAFNGFEVSTQFSKEGWLYIYAFQGFYKAPNIPEQPVAPRHIPLEATTRYLNSLRTRVPLRIPLQGYYKVPNIPEGTSRSPYIYPLGPTHRALPKPLLGKKQPASLCSQYLMPKPHGQDWSGLGV